MAIYLIREYVKHATCISAYQPNANTLWLWLVCLSCLVMLASGQVMI